MNHSFSRRRAFLPLLAVLFLTVLLFSVSSVSAFAAEDEESPVIIAPSEAVLTAGEIFSLCDCPKGCSSLGASHTDDSGCYGQFSMTKIVLNGEELSVNASGCVHFCFPEAGEAEITITATDLSGNRSETTVFVTVLPADDAETEAEADDDLWLSDDDTVFPNEDGSYTLYHYSYLTYVTVMAPEGMELSYFSADDILVFEIAEVNYSLSAYYGLYLLENGVDSDFFAECVESLASYTEGSILLGLSSATCEANGLTVYALFADYSNSADYSGWCAGYVTGSLWAELPSGDFLCVDLNEWLYEGSASELFLLNTDVQTLAELFFSGINYDDEADYDPADLASYYDYLYEYLEDYLDTMTSLPDADGYYTLYDDYGELCVLLPAPLSMELLYGFDWALEFTTETESSTLYASYGLYLAEDDYDAEYFALWLEMLAEWCYDDDSLVVETYSDLSVTDYALPAGAAVLNALAMEDSYVCISLWAILPDGNYVEVDVEEYVYDGESFLLETEISELLTLFLGDLTW